MGTDDGLSSTWKNPHNTLNLTLSHRLHQASFVKDSVLNIEKGVQTYWGGSVPIWFRIDLGPNRTFRASSYALRHGYNAHNSYARDFKLHGPPIPHPIPYLPRLERRQQLG